MCSALWDFVRSVFPQSGVYGEWPRGGSGGQPCNLLDRSDLVAPAPFPSHHTFPQPYNLWHGQPYNLWDGQPWCSTPWLVRLPKESQPPYTPITNPTQSTHLTGQVPVDTPPKCPNHCPNAHLPQNPHPPRTAPFLGQHLHECGLRGWAQVGPRPKLTWLTYS